MTSPNASTLYRKEGRKYVPVQLVEDVYHRFPHGAHLVVADLPHCTIFRYNVENLDVAVLAALVRCENRLVEEICVESALRPSRPPITPEQHRAWKNFIAVMGDSGRTVTHNSAQQIAASALQKLSKDIEQTLADPRVREAYEKFKLVVTMLDNEEK